MEEDLQLINDIAVAVTDFVQACVEPTSTKGVLVLLLIVAAYGSCQCTKLTFGCFFMWRILSKKGSLLDNMLNDKRLDRLAHIYKRNLENENGVKKPSESAAVVFNLKSVARAYSIHVLSETPVMESLGSHFARDLKYEIKSGISLILLILGVLGSTLAAFHDNFYHGSFGLPAMISLIVAVLFIIHWISSKEISALIFIALLQQLVKRLDSVYLNK
ncbi:MAG: hypothetical protein MJY98_05485 [Fibrobacter sp.]|nr:hypothetical protein [Fibrobacter sp.]